MKNDGSVAWHGAVSLCSTCLFIHQFVFRILDIAIQHCWINNFSSTSTSYLSSCALSRSTGSVFSTFRNVYMHTPYRTCKFSQLFDLVMSLRHIFCKISFAKWSDMCVFELRIFIALCAAAFRSRVSLSLIWKCNMEANIGYIYHLYIEFTIRPIRSRRISKQRV